jgi:hypothetical protein
MWFLTFLASTHQLGTIQELGVLIENATKTMRTGLETWSTTLYDGGQDSSGKTIMCVLSSIYTNTKD